MQKKPNVLFLSTGDSTRSLMAEGFLRTRAGDYFQAVSVGIEPGEPHPLAAEVMREVGVDISGERPRSVAESVKSNFSYAIVVYDAAKERSPIFPFTPKLLRWSITNPSVAACSPDEKKEMFRRVRDEIHANIQKFLKETAQKHAEPAALAA